MEKLTLLLSLFVLIVYSNILATEYQFIGNVKSYTQKQNIIDIDCEGAKVELTILADDLIRIKMFPGNNFPSTCSYSVLPVKKVLIANPVENLGKFLKITTKELTLLIQKSPCRLSFVDPEGKLICKDHDAYGMGWNGSKLFCWKELHDETFYGLGEKTRGLNKRGDVYTMWNSDIPGYSPTTDPLYQSHPFFLGLYQQRGFGIFVDNSYRSHFNFGAGNSQFYFFGVDDGILDYYFFYGPSLKKVIKRYSELVGKIPLPPKWSLGYQQCRWSYYPESEVLELAQRFRNKHIPCDVIYLDIHYMNSYRCFTWHPHRFPKPKKMLRKLKKMGFKVVAIIDPGIKVDHNYWVYQQGIAGDHFCKYPDGSYYQGQVWPGWCCFPDFSKPETRRWWGNLYKNLVNDGIMGFWNDMNEPATWGGTFPDIVQFYDEGLKSNHLKMHNLYGLLMAKATYEGVKTLRPDRRPFVLTRAGFSGVQRYAAVWTGDNVASWEHLRLSINMCLGLSMSGVAFCGPDVGGFVGSPTPELFTRWIQLGTFMPFLRTHTSINTPDQEPWSFGDNYEEINKKFIQLRYQLLPYIYNAFYKAATTGIPIMRPMILEYQHDPKTLTMESQYMFGKDLLIAPIDQKNQRVKKVYFPPGEWLDFWNGKRTIGPRQKWVDAPLNKIPVFVKAGAIVPMQQTMDYVDENKIDPLILNIYPGQGVFADSLYEDDGVSFESGYCMTPFKLNMTKDNIIFTIDDRIGSFSPPARSYLVKFYSISKTPDKIELNNKQISFVNKFLNLYKKKKGWHYDSHNKILYIKFPDSTQKMELKVELL